MKLTSIMIGTEDLDRLAGYYTKVFGEPQWNEAGYVGWGFDDGGGFAVGQHDGVKGRNEQPGRVIWNLDSNDVAGDFARLKAAGATVVQEPYQPGGPDTGMWIATFSDPDDNYFQLMSPM